MNIGDYQIVRLLGSGGMSEVYEAENPRLGSRHAVKVYSYQKEDEEVRARFLVEGKLLAKLNHPRIVKVTDFGTDQPTGRPYFVMDLVLDASGTTKSLADIPAGCADEEMIARWYDDMRDGLAYIHSLGIVHRDLKLQNVLIGPDGHAVLTDFGISRIFKPEETGRTVVDPVQTIFCVRNGRNPVMGSLGYMAPEIEMGVQASPESDWYALGVIVYRLLTGTWCDARTDVVGTLETYDPVWKRIIPKLLHANPAGRACLSFAEEKAKDREAAEFAAEERWLKEKGRGHLARHVARWMSGAAAGLAVAVIVLALRLSSTRSAGAALLEQAMEEKAELQERLELSDFDGLFPIPDDATSEDLAEEGGPASTEDYKRGRFDTWVRVRGLLNRTRSGELDRAGLATALRQERENVVSSADYYEELFPEEYSYNSNDDGVVMADLLKRAANRLEAKEAR